MHNALGPILQNHKNKTLSMDISGNHSCSYQYSGHRMLSVSDRIWDKVRNAVSQLSLPWRWIIKLVTCVFLGNCEWQVTNSKNCTCLV
jgi:hypothetical protein